MDLGVSCGFGSIGGKLGVVWSFFIGENIFVGFFGFCKIAKKFVTFYPPLCAGCVELRWV